MNPTMNYYCGDAAERIAELIDDWDRKRQHAEKKKTEQDEAIEEVDSDITEIAELNDEDYDEDHDEELEKAEAIKDDEAKIIELEDNRKDLMSKRSAAMRDMHRAQTSVRALKEALGFVLLEHACKDGQQHAMPDVDTYLASRIQAA